MPPPGRWPNVAARLPDRCDHLPLSPLALFTASAIIGDCGSGSSSGSGVTLNLMNTGLTSGSGTRTALRSSGGTNWLAPSLRGPGILSVGTNAASEPLSLQYAFQSISMCQETDATTSFGFSTLTGCIAAHSDPGSGDSMGMTLDTFKSDIAGTDRAFDLMHADDLARLAATPAEITSDQVGDYQYAILTWNPFIRVKGQVTLADSSVLGTANEASIRTDGIPVTRGDSLNDETPELAYIQSANGGVMTQFQKAISIEANKDDSLDIIFNPDGVLKGCSGSTAGDIVDAEDSLTLPMLPVTAVLRESSDTLVRESYTVEVTAAFDVRIDLYSLKSDAEKNVRAATVTDLPGNDDTFCWGGDHRVMRVETDATDGSLSFYWSSTSELAMVSGLVRTSEIGGTVDFGQGSDAAGAAYSGLPSDESGNTIYSGTITAVTTTEL